MSSNHSMSVFTNSCRSTPRVRLPPSRSIRSRQGLSRSFDHDSRRSKRTVQIFNDTTSNRSLTNRSSKDPTTLESDHVRFPSRNDPSKLLSNAISGQENSGRMTDYSELFSTLLESNELLRQEIRNLQDDHRRTLATIKHLHKHSGAAIDQDRENQQLKVKLRGPAHSNEDQSHRGVQLRLRQHEPPTDNDGAQSEDDDILSQSVPPKLLENTWVESESGSEVEQHNPASSSMESASTSSLVHMKPQQVLDRQSQNAGTDTCHDADDESQVESPLPGTYYKDLQQPDAKESLTVEEIEPEQFHSDSDDSLHESSAHTANKDEAFSLRSTTSLSSSCSALTTSTDRRREDELNGDDPFASPGMVVIENMWDNFSVEEYASYSRSPDADKEGEKNRSTSKEWSPRITIPEPFSMTIREANTPRRKKSRALLVAEQERLERQAREEAELKKQFHATPIPASTYLPLYDLVNAKNEQRREHVMRMSKEILKSTERPFSFMKREEEKKLQKDEQLRLSQEMEMEEQKEMEFKAKPIPKKMFDPEVNERIHEQEEYRQIKMKMRAEELMACSKLPKSMKVKGRECDLGALRRQRLEKNQKQAFLSSEHKFQPTASRDIPDYDQAFMNFQKQLAIKKKSKQTTVTEPFYLHTEHIPSRKQKIVEDMQKDNVHLPETRWPYVTPRSKVCHDSPNPPKARSSPVMYPAQMTETARMRQSITQEKLARMVEKEAMEEEQRMAKKERGRSLQASVSQKSLSLDPTAWLEERKREKLKQLRTKDKDHHMKYQQQLDDIKQRVDSRPLLFEQASQISARRSAENKYIESLKKAGLSDDEIQALNKEL